MYQRSREFFLPQTVNIPVPLYKSVQGKYYTGYAENLIYTGPNISAWASLYNPINSGVNLHVNVWTVTSLYSIFRAQIWVNASLPGNPMQSDFVTTSNLAVEPTRKPRVKLLYADTVTGEPTGITAFVRRGEAESTIVAEEDGKFIFAPGGSFTVFLSHPENPDARAEGRVAFGWWEEPIWPKYH